jgi:hypothetical protein
MSMSSSTSTSTGTSTRTSKRVLLWVVLQALSLVSASSFSPLVSTTGSTTGSTTSTNRGRIRKESRPRPSFSFSFSSKTNQSRRKHKHKNANAALQSQSGQAMSMSMSSSDSTQQNLNLGRSRFRFITVKKALPLVAVAVAALLLALYKTLSNANVTVTVTTTRVLGSINALFVHFPYVAAFMVCGFKGALADGIVQKSTIQMAAASVSNDKNKNNKTNNNNANNANNNKNDKNNLSFEYKRNIAFLFYGGLYQGCFQEFMFNTIFPLLFGTATDLRTVITKVSFDMLVVSPFLCLPVAYVLKGAIYKDTIIDSIKRYMYDVKENKLLKKYWMLWSPAQCLTFSLIPEHFRIGFIAGISFFWLMILSSISGKKVVKA